MAKLRINGDSSGYVDLEAPNAASSSTLDLDQVPQKNAANTFTTHQVIRTDTASGGYTAYPSLTLRNDNVNGYSVLHFNRGATTQSARIEVDNNNGSPTIGIYATSAGNGIKVDHNGYVTKPQQPAFHADAGAAQTVAGTIQFTGVMTNNGNHYNSSTYTFTAPVTGIYKFSARIMKAQDATVDFHFRVNGSQVGNNLYDTATATNQLNSGTINMVRHLNSSDSVTVYSASTSGTNWIHAGHREFTGYLIG